MSSFEPKGLVSTTSDFEVDPRDLAYRRQQETIRTLDGVRVGLAGLSLLAGIVILGTSANAIMVYNDTHVSTAFNLPLWPTAFDLRPTVALVVTSSFVIVASLMSLLFSQARVNQTTPHALNTTLAFLGPMISFLAAVIGTAFFYAVNASLSADTLQSWSCRWSPYSPSSGPGPRFGTLCRQSEAALYLAVVLIPLEVAALAAAAVRVSLARRAQGLLPAERKLSSSVGGSPALA